MVFWEALPPNSPPHLGGILRGNHEDAGPENCDMTSRVPKGAPKRMWATQHVHACMHVLISRP